MKLPNLDDSPILHSRPRAEVDWKCPRDRYYSYEYDGVGVQGDTESLEMFLGTTIHDGASVGALQHRDGKSIEVDLIATTAQEQMYENLVANIPGTPEEVEEYAQEQSTLINGLIRGYYKHQWPLIMSRWPRILAVEQDVTFRHDHAGNPDPKGNFIFMAKPDLVVANEDGSEIVYVEHKTTKSKKIEWINQWERTVQVHATREAIKQSLDIDCTGVVVQGWYKGYESYGKISSPFAYAYHRWGNPPFTQTETLYEYKAGYKRYPVWTLDGGVAKWVENMPEQVLMEQFPQTPVIFPNPDMVKRFFAQRALRELDIRMGRDMIIAAREAGDMETVQSVLDVTFPQKFRECSPAHGFECPRLHLCWGGDVDPLKAGCKHRVPHHSAEVKE